MKKCLRARKGIQTDFHGLEILPKLPDIRPGFVEFIFNEVPSSDIFRPPRNNLTSSKPPYLQPLLDKKRIFTYFFLLFFFFHANIYWRE